MIFLVNLKLMPVCSDISRGVRKWTLVAGVLPGVVVLMIKFIFFKNEKSGDD